jgi:hypothetical protein
LSSTKNFFCRRRRFVAKLYTARINNVNERQSAGSIKTPPGLLLTHISILIGFLPIDQALSRLPVI